jgi:hypothetical protein
VPTANVHAVAQLVLVTAALLIGSLQSFSKCVIELKVTLDLQRRSSARFPQGSTPCEIETTMALFRLRASAIVTSGQRPSGMSFGSLPRTRARKYQALVPLLST